jgi:hypothetical protein
VLFGTKEIFVQTNFPTVELYFVLAFTCCRLVVYKESEPFIRTVLETHKVEFLDGKERQSWKEINTQILAQLVNEALPKLLEKAGLVGAVAQVVSDMLMRNSAANR